MEAKFLCIGKEKIATLISTDIPEDAIAICPNPVTIPKLVPRLLDTKEYFEPIVRNAIPKKYYKKRRKR